MISEDEHCSSTSNLKLSVKRSDRNVSINALSLLSRTLLQLTPQWVRFLRVHRRPCQEHDAHLWRLHWSINNTTMTVDSRACGSRLRSILTEAWWQPWTRGVCLLGQRRCPKYHGWEKKKEKTQTHDEAVFARMVSMNRDVRRRTWRGAARCRGSRRTGAHTSLVSTTPFTYFPRTESTQRTLDSTASHRSLSQTLTSIFLAPPQRLVWSPGSPRARSAAARERARRSGARGEARPRGSFPDAGDGWWRSASKMWV